MSKKLQIILFVFALALSTAALTLTLSTQRPDGIGRVVNSFEYLLESIYREGFAENRIDYDDPVLNERAVFITTDLDEKHAQAVMKKLSYLDNKEPGSSIDLYIDTLGGTGGEMLSNFIHSLVSPVNVYALDYCCSAGTIVLASATGSRYAFSTSRIIVHMVMPVTAPEDDEEYGPIEQESSINEKFWTSYSSLPSRLYSVDEERFYYFTAEQALEFGLIDEIIETDRS